MGSMSRMQGHGFYSQVMGLIPRMQDNVFDSQDFHCIQGCTLDAIKVACIKCMNLNVNKSRVLFVLGQQNENLAP